MNREQLESSAENFHYGQRIKRRATYLLRTFIHIIIKPLKFSFGLSAQPRPLNFCGKKSAGHFFSLKISKPLTSKESKDLAFVTVRFSFVHDRHDINLRSHDLKKSGKENK